MRGRKVIRRAFRERGCASRLYYGFFICTGVFWIFHIARRDDDSRDCRICFPRAMGADLRPIMQVRSYFARYNDNEGKRGRIAISEEFFLWKIYLKRSRHF